MGDCLSCLIDSSTSGAAEMGNVPTKAKKKGRTPSSKKSSSGGSSKLGSEGHSGPVDVFGSNLTPDQAKRIQINPQEIDFGFKKKFHDEYEVTKLLGKGAFASAYQVTPRENSKYFGRYDLAVKVISKGSLKSVQDARWLKQEIEIMRRVGGSINMVHVYECYESNNHVYILMELCRYVFYLFHLSIYGVPSSNSVQMCENAFRFVSFLYCYTKSTHELVFFFLSSVCCVCLIHD